MDFEDDDDIEEDWDKVLDGDAHNTNKSKPLMSRMLLNDNKAGMEGLDKVKINRIIHVASKGSRYYQNELKKEEQMKHRIEEQRNRHFSLTPEQIQCGILEADKLVLDLEENRDLGNTLVHIDMDMFYAAVEMRDCPHLKEKPMAVGGNSMLSTSNYIARKYGVRAAMPGFIAKKLCPSLVIVKPNFNKYKAVSEEVRDILKDYDPEFSPMSLDEAHLNFTKHLKSRADMPADQRTFAKRLQCTDCNCVSSRSASKYEYLKQRSHQSTLPKGAGCQTLFETRSSERDSGNRCMCYYCGTRIDIPIEWVTFGISDWEAVREMRFRIEHRTELTASAGIAPNTMLAKICSDKNKPNGQYKILAQRDAVLNFINKLPIRKVCGIGKVSEQMLSALDINVCRDIYENRGIIYHLNSKISFHHLMRISLGIGSTELERDTERKSMSVERTFSEIYKAPELLAKCHELCQSLSEDLKQENLIGKTITLKIKTVNFEVNTRARSLMFTTNECEYIFNTAAELLRVEIQACSPKPLRLRLMGVRASNFIPNSESMQRTITDLFKCPVPNPMHKIEGANQQMPSSSLKKGSTTTRNVVDKVSVSPLPKRKANVTIKQFMKSAATISKCPDIIKNTSYECPICNISIICHSLITINKHLDSCLYTASPDSQAEENKKPKLCADAKTSEPESVLYNNKGLASNSNVFTCPVCNEQRRGGDLVRFNRHIDLCLNQKAIGEMECAQPSGSGQRKRCSEMEFAIPLAKKSRASPKTTSPGIKSFIKNH